jgi:hypothetical protein
MNRWKAALAVLWRTEPAPALGLYFLLAVAQVSYIHLLGHYSYVQGVRGSPSPAVVIKEGSDAGLFAYAFFTWRMWLGGATSCGLSLLWKLLMVGAAVMACYKTPSPFLFGLLTLSLASFVPLFASAVLDRVNDRSKRFVIIRAIGRAFREEYKQPRGPRQGEPQAAGGHSSPEG